MNGSQPRIYVAGHRGMVGSALIRELARRGYKEVITRDRAQLDLLDQRAVQEFVDSVKPEYIFVAAARVGGIHANDTYRADFLYENLTLETNLIHAAHRSNVSDLLFLGSSCVYPRDCPQPIREEYLLTGPLEQTNEPYAIAKIAGIKLCEAYRRQYARQYISVMPTNLYGPNDNYDLDTSHVLPALIRKAHEAKVRGNREMIVWGSGNPRREFLFVDDLAEACVMLMEQQRSRATELPSLINVGCGEDMTIKELARTVMDVIGFSGDIRFDTSRPDGTPRKLLDVTRINRIGWKPSTPLAKGVRLSFDDYLSRVSRAEDCV